MSLKMPQVRIGEPLSFESLTVFPLFAEADGNVNYQLSDEAMNAATVVVEEVGEQGSVPDLLVENSGDTRVLFLEGEELRGAKQNRILNTSILVPPKSKTKVPVSCVERGRWRYRDRQFSSGKTRSPHKLHYSLKSSVAQSLKSGAGHRSDQGAVWAEVDKMTAAFGFSSPTAAMADTYENLSGKIADYREKLKYPEGAAGVVIALGKKVVSVDLFDKPATCQKAWERLLSGCIVEALEAKAEGQTEPQAVEQVLRESTAASWSEATTVGDGKEFRTEFNGSVASALVLDDPVVHLNVLTPPT